MAAGRERSKAERERNREYQREYYEKNRERLLEEKRERYRSDPEYREEMRIRDLRRYWFDRRQKRKRELPELEFSDLKPRGEVTLTDADGGEHRVKVYDSEAVARIVNRSVQTVRNWVLSGVLPSPTLRGWDIGARGNPLLYREDETRAIYDCREMLQRPTHPLEDSVFAKCVWEAFSKLPEMTVASPWSDTAADDGEPVEEVRGECLKCGTPYEGPAPKRGAPRCPECGFRVKVMKD